MSDLRDHRQPCEHGELASCHAWTDYLCPGGRQVTIDPLLDAARALVDAQTIEGFGIFEPLRHGLFVVDAALDQEIELDDYERVILDRALDRMEAKGDTG